jgi:hypothetical protein
MCSLVWITESIYGESSSRVERNGKLETKDRTEGWTYNADGSGR